MKKIILILFSVSGLKANAQSFAPIGAQWTYDDQGGLLYHHYPNAFFSITDTVINGQSCHIVIGDCRCGTGSPNYIYGLNRRVYWYNSLIGDFTLLYDFNLNAGGTWTVLAKNTSGDSLTLHVDSVRYDSINGNLIKVQFVSTVATFGNAYFFEGPIVEGIGSKFCLYPQSASCDPPTVGLRCYQDSVIGLYDTHLAPSCEEEFVDSGIGIDEIKNNIGVTVFPNPFHESAVLTIQNNISTQGILEIADVAGRLISEEKFSGYKILIEKKNIEEGIYFYHLRMAEATASGKFIIQ